MLSLSLHLLKHLCLETGILPIFLLLKCLHPNSVILHLAKSGYQLSQSERAVCPDQPIMQTRSGLRSQMGQQTLHPTVFRTSATLVSTLITSASTSAWRSCRHFTPQRKPTFLPECSWRPVITPQIETTSLSWRGITRPPPFPCLGFATLGSKMDEATRWHG